MDWFLYDNGLRDERVKTKKMYIQHEIFFIKFIFFYSTNIFITTFPVSIFGLRFVFKTEFYFQYVN